MWGGAGGCAGWGCGGPWARRVWVSRRPVLVKRACVACGALPHRGVGEGLGRDEGQRGVVASHVRCELTGVAAGE
eukprot:7387902-Prymnesium_polylepis.1